MTRARDTSQLIVEGFPDALDSQTAYAVNTSLTVAALDSLITNVGATGTVTLTMPPATVGLVASVSRKAAYAFRLLPALTERFEEGVADGYLELTGSGDVVVFCYIAGMWSWVSDSANWRLQNGYNRLLQTITTAVTTTPTTRVAVESGNRFTNFGATQITEHDLPVGADGLRYSFMRQANFAVRVDPNGSQIIGGGAAGKYLEITSTRGQVDLEWMTDSGMWEVTGGSAVVGYEP